MTEEKISAHETGGFNRRNFLKGAGAALAASSLAPGLMLAPSPSLAAGTEASTTITSFRCPICSRDFATFDELRDHFASDHPGAVAPVPIKLKVNNKDYEVLIHLIGLCSARSSSSSV